MSSEDKPIDRCVCFDVTFEQMVIEECKTVVDAAIRWGCGTKCGLCRPYIERTIATGEVRHAVINAGTATAG